MQTPRCRAPLWLCTSFRENGLRCWNGRENFFAFSLEDAPSSLTVTISTKPGSGYFLVSVCSLPVSKRNRSRLSQWLGRARSGMLISPQASLKNYLRAVLAIQHGCARGSIPVWRQAGGKMSGKAAAANSVEAGLREGLLESQATGRAALST